MSVKGFITERWLTVDTRSLALTYDAPPPGETKPKNVQTRLLFRSGDL